VDYRCRVGFGEIPTFVVERRAGLLDVWTVYDALIERTQETSIELAFRHPDFAPLVRAWGAERVVEQARRSRPLLRRAIVDGDWPPYLEYVRALAAHSVEHGIGFAGWRGATRVFQHRLIPGLVEAYAGDPPRLTAALAAALEFLEFSTAMVAEEYAAERSRIDATLEQRTRQLESANRELDAFSSAVAHELRAPLRAVNGFAQILVEDHAAQLTGEAAAHLGKIQTNVKRMGALVDALLGLSRLSRSELEIKRVDLSALARSVIGQLAAGDPQRSVAVCVQDGLYAASDPRLARTLLENLIGNAWKFTARSSAPRIELGSIDGRVVYVRDNGAGFDQVQAGKLFSPFERMHTADEFPGTGIGLATVQRIVQRHGGRIWATARVGGGATFFFTLAPSEPRTAGTAIEAGLQPDQNS
jgi:signal transduction histidine kinase